MLENPTELVGLIKVPMYLLWLYIDFVFKFIFKVYIECSVKQFFLLSSSLDTMEPTPRRMRGTS